MEYGSIKAVRQRVPSDQGVDYTDTVKSKRGGVPK
jgi:hypothetical protein